MTSHAASATQMAITTQRMRLGRGRSLVLSVEAIGQPVYRPRSERSRWASAWAPALRCLWALSLCFAWLGASPLASASEPIRLDIHRGPLVASSRITGLGGAFTGVGEGVDGAFRNPAALSNRSERSTSWFDYDLSLDWLITPGDKLDYDADGVSIGADTDFSAVNFGLALQAGPFSLGVLAAAIGYQRNTGDRLVASISDVLFGSAWAFDEGALLVGLGVNARTFDLQEPEVVGEGGESGVSALFSGPSWDFGVLWRPRERPWRVGLQVRLGTTMRPKGEAQGAFSLGREIGEVVAPFQVAAGFSYFRAADPARRYNPRLRSGSGLPSDARRGDLRYLLLSADLVLSGATRDAYNIEGFLRGTPQPAGASPVASVHLGAEGEVISNLLRARLGGYLEPSRVVGAGVGRVHLTGGVEVRLFRLWIWQIKASFAFDAASRFQNVLLGVGIWN